MVKLGNCMMSWGAVGSPNRVWVNFWPIDWTDLKPSPTRAFKYGDLTGVEIGASESTDLAAEFSDDTWSE